MTGIDALLTIAEMAIALAGFSAVVAAFARQGALSPEDRSRFVWLFSTAFVAALLAFVPVLLIEANFEPPELWRCASGVMLLAWFASIGLLLYENKYGSRGRDFSSGPLLFVPSVANLTIQLANVSGVVWEPSPAAYITGVLVWLYAASLVFMAIVLNRDAA